MVQIETFGIEKWMDDYQPGAKYDLAETCCASISLDDLQSLSVGEKKSIISSSKKLGYGDIRGSKELIANLARLYSRQAPSPLPEENILITSGAIAANHLLMYALVGPGDHVICHYPTYQQLYAEPTALGAEVDLWKANPDKNWSLDIEELKRLLKPNTKMIIVKSLLEGVVKIAEEKDIIVLSDEVYRPLYHSVDPQSPEFPPSLVSLGSKHTIVTGSMSKAYSLAGIRLGWIASRNSDIIEKVAGARHYTIISVSQLDSAVAAYALSDDVHDGLLSRNMNLARDNLKILDQFVINHSDVCDWVKPVAGTTAFVRFHKGGKPIDAQVLCRRLVQEAGVCWAPGDYSFGKEFKGYVRIGYVCETQVLRDGLAQTALWLQENFDALPTTEQSPCP
ncbi:putative aminotransferase [Trichodelitschia bisporula]|uniref:Putative aminotransferase n=1 Tax=Trichodelitschia bisporula TaxID=703511 RepID=A0A6G1I3K6_9PEZI|nr:putative aminotransferase [Trichodelitschia bisporula]